MTEETIKLDYDPRNWQNIYHAGCIGRKRSVLICSRQIGKTWASIAELVARALNSPENTVSAYVCPFVSQARRVAWARLKSHLGPMLAHCNVRETDLSVTLPGNRKIQLLGADNESARGMSIRTILFDELDNIPSAIIREVFLPTLNAHGEDASIMYIGTLAGGKSRLWEMYLAHKDDPNWFSMVQPASTAGLFTETWLQQQRLEMGESAYLREMECDPKAPVAHAVLGELMQDVEAEQRVRTFPVRNSVEIITGWDLGIRDFTSIWFGHLVGNWIELIDYREYSGIGLSEVVNRVLADYSRHRLGATILPHDIVNRELVSGASRLDLFEDNWPGFTEVMSPAPAIADTLHSSRMNLHRCVFEGTRCELGVSRLKSARYKVDRTTGTVMDTIVHDDNSHCLDAFRTMMHWIEREYPSGGSSGLGTSHPRPKVVGSLGDVNYNKYGV